MEKPLAIIEISNSAIKLIVGVFLNDQPLVIYRTSILLEGEIYQGNILNRDGLINKIQRLKNIQDKEIKLKLAISDVVLVLPPLGFTVYQNEKITNVVSPTSLIEPLDIQNVISLVKRENLKPGLTYIDIVPDAFFTDDNKAYGKPPIGVKSNSLQIKAKIHTLPLRLVEDYTSLIIDSGLRPRRTIVSSYASGGLINNQMRDLNNYLLLDMGEDMTTLSLFGDKQIYDTTYFFKGFKDLKRQVATKLGITLEEAHKLINLYGLNNFTNSFKPIIATSHNNGQENNIYLASLNQAIKEYLESYYDEIIKAMNTLLKNYGDDVRHFPLVIIGGLSYLDGIKDFLSERFASNEKVLFFVPQVIGARDATLTSVLGALVIASSYLGSLSEEEARVSKITRVVRK